MSQSLAMNVVGGAKASFVNLPLELLAEICNYFVFKIQKFDPQSKNFAFSLKPDDLRGYSKWNHIEGRDNLRALALTCRATHESANRALYTNIVMIDNVQKMLFLRTMLTNPALSHYAKVALVVLSQDLSKEADDFAEADLCQVFQPVIREVILFEEAYFATLAISPETAQFPTWAYEISSILRKSYETYPDLWSAAERAFLHGQAFTREPLRKTFQWSMLMTAIMGYLTRVKTLVVSLIGGYQVPHQVVQLKDQYKASLLPNLDHLIINDGFSWGIFPSIKRQFEQVCRAYLKLGHVKTLELQVGCDFNRALGGLARVESLLIHQMTHWNSQALASLKNLKHLKVGRYVGHRNTMRRTSSSISDMLIHHRSNLLTLELSAVYVVKVLIDTSTRLRLPNLRKACLEISASSLGREVELLNVLPPSVEELTVSFNTDSERWSFNPNWERRPPIFEFLERLISSRTTGATQLQRIILAESFTDCLRKEWREWTASASSAVSLPPFEQRSWDVLSESEEASPENSTNWAGQPKAGGELSRTWAQRLHDLKDKAVIFKPGGLCLTTPQMTEVWVFNF